MAIRRGGRKRRELPRAEVNITNLIDVTMTLLVVFMMVAPMLKEGLEIELPSSRVSETIETDEKVILVECDKNGLVRVNKKEVMMSAVEDTLRSLTSETGILPVQVRADKDLPFGVVVGLWGEIRAAGIESVGVELTKISISE